jgi:hypothetical protein
MGEFWEWKREKIVLLSSYADISNKNNILVPNTHPG